MELLFLQYLTTIQWDKYSPYIDIISDRDPRTAQDGLLRDFFIDFSKIWNIRIHRTRTVKISESRISPYQRKNLTPVGPWSRAYLKVGACSMEKVSITVSEKRKNKYKVSIEGNHKSLMNERIESLYP